MGVHTACASGHDDPYVIEQVRTIAWEGGIMTPEREAGVMEGAEAIHRDWSLAGSWVAETN